VDEKFKPCGSFDTKINLLASARQKSLTNGSAAAFSRAASLAATKESCDIFGSFGGGTRRRTTLTVNIHCYEQLIAGRTYFIEVQAVTDSRWRAQIARLPGMPMAMMPFYGSTPEEAAHELSRWLSLVYNGNTKQ